MIALLLAVALSATAVQAHNALAAPLRFFGDATAGPISAATFPCGVPQDQFSSVVASAPIAATYAAGSSAPIKYSSSNNHNGGSCQFSLSYDNGKTWKVVQSIQGDCPNSADSAAVQLPANLPSGTAIFSWTWLPKSSGGPEFYMSCSKVAITSSTTSTSGLDSLPDMFVAVVNSCKIDSSSGHLDLMFPNPGQNVITSPAFSGLAAGTGLLSGCGAVTSPVVVNNGNDAALPASVSATSVLQNQAGVVLTSSTSYRKHAASTTSPIIAAADLSQCDQTYLTCGQAWLDAGAKGPYSCNDDYILCRSGSTPTPKQSDSPIVSSSTNIAPATTLTSSTIMITQARLTRTTASSSSSSPSPVSSSMQKNGLAVVMNVAGPVSDSNMQPTAMMAETFYESSSCKTHIALGLTTFVLLILS